MMCAMAVDDVRYALRGFMRAPGFTVAAVLSLAIGIGANTAIFSIASALLLRPLPYQDSERLVILWNRAPGIGIAEDWFSTGQYFDIKNGHTGFEDVAILIGAVWNLTGDGEPERVGTLRVSSNLLPMLGVRPELGELFTADDDRPGRTGRALISHGTWMRRYGGDPSVVGRSLTLNGQQYIVSGVLPAGFDLPREVVPTLGGAEHSEIILPLPLSAEAPAIRNGEDYNIIGKLKPAVAEDAAQVEMDAITARLREEHPNIYPAHGGLTFDIVPLREQVVGDVRRSIVVLTGAVLFVLLIACANVANLLLARALARQQEAAVRAALGAGRARLVRQYLTESLLLAVMGGAAGLLLAAGTLELVRAFGSASVPRLHDIRIDQTVLAFTAALSIGAGLLFGLMPALTSAREGLRHALARTGQRSSSGGALWGRGVNVRRLLVGAQLALSVMLLIGSGLLIRSFIQLQKVSPGFNPRGLLTMEVSLTGRRYPDAARVIESYREVWSRLRAVPGVEAAGGVSMLPLSQMFAWGPIVLEGRALPSGESFINVDQRTVGGDYFAAMQIPLLSGRLFSEHDTREMPRVVVVDDRMAALLWPNEDPLGKRLRRGGMDTDASAPWLTVVGVVGRVKQYTLDERDSRIAMYHPHTQAGSRSLNIVVRAGAPEAITSAVVQSIRGLDPDLPIYNVKTMAARVDDSLARRRFAMLLLTLSAGIAVVLAALGTYGVMAYLVNQGQRDLGIRMALGASPAAIRAMVVRHGFFVAMAGVGVGVAAATAMAGVMRNMLFGIQPIDPITFATGAAVLFAVALAGCLAPARRAAAVQPSVAIRTE
jgi:predicted permease